MAKQIHINHIKSARDKLVLATPYPWSNISTTVSAIEPVVREVFPNHFDSFKAAAKEPRWVMLPRFISGGGTWDDGPRRDNFAQASATENRRNAQIAAVARDQLVAFLNGLLLLVEDCDEDSKAIEQRSITTESGQAPNKRRAQTQNASIFISYCHKDKTFFDALLLHLKPLERAGLITTWSDKKIIPGANWMEEIKNALAYAKVAVMMVSPAFLASEFINDHELGPLLERADKEGVRILWIPVRACVVKETPLGKYQAVIPLNKPLAEMKAERDKALVEICEALKKAVAP